MKIFISYKTGVPNDQEAELLYNELSRNGYDVYLDKRELYAGMIWDNSIYDNISDSDVLVVIITKDAASPWVQREVDYARGCRIEIIPVVVNSDDIAEAPNVMTNLAINNRQYARAFGSSRPEIRYREVINTLQRSQGLTRDKQKEWLAQLQDKWEKADKANRDLQPYKPARLDYSSYLFFPTVRAAHPCTIHIAGGNITDLRGVDVIVNPENVYMQMQRIFAEGVSKHIRLDGARIESDRIQEDTIQQELNAQLFGSTGGGIPVGQKTVLVTSAGYDRSKLRARGVQYVFHVAIQAATRDRELPVENSDVVKESVMNCLEKALEISTQTTPITSIVFPLLASGNAGLPVKESVGAILESFKEFLSLHANPPLQHLYLAAYTRRDIAVVEGIFDSDSQLRKLTS